MSLRELYQEIIIDHGKNPRHVGTLPHASHVHVGHNPLCGDKLTLYVMLQEGVISDLVFEGEGCAISMASTSLMIEAVKGKSNEQIQRLFANFHTLVTEGKEEGDVLGKLAVFGGVAEFPVRVKCATLAWHTLQAALLNQTEMTSTEI